MGAFCLSGVFLSNIQTMKNLVIATLVLISLLLTSCYEEDPGPRQSDSRSYALVDFDRIDAGDELIITIQQGSSFSIEAEGDRRNVDDLLVFKNGTSLVLRFKHYQKRQYNTSINITLPNLTGVDFSGAVNARISGFTNINRFDLSLSGASLAQMDVEASELYISLSGASQLRLNGKGQNVNGIISGASLLSAFSYPFAQVALIVSGASSGKVSVAEHLEVNASGASLVLYRGNPQLEVEVTGESIVRQD